MKKTDSNTRKTKLVLSRPLAALTTTELALVVGGVPKVIDPGAR